MKKKIKILAIVIAILAFASGCALNTGARIYDNEKIIVKNADSYNLINSRWQVDENCLYGSVGRMEGMGTIWKFDTSEATDVNISYRIKVSSGKAKLVLISADNRLTNLVECTAESDFEEEKTDTIQVNTGKSRIKLVGAKDTKIEIEISADKGDIRSFN